MSNSIAQSQSNSSVITLMTVNADKCHLVAPSHKNELLFAKIRDATIQEEHVAKLLGILIDANLSINDHVKMIC